MTRTEAKLAAYFKLGNLALSRYLVKPFRGAAAVLMYHQVLPDSERKTFSNPAVINTVSTTAFDQQLAELKAHYHPCSIDELLSMFQEGSSRETGGKLPVVLTFDDGYKDNLAHALPLLERHSIPATIYIATHRLAGNAQIWWYELWDILCDTPEVTLNGNDRRQTWTTQSDDGRRQCYVDLSARILALAPNDQRTVMESLRDGRPARTYDAWCLNGEEVTMLDRHPLVTIGAHTHSHPNLSLLGDSEAREEMLKSKQILESLVGHPVHHFAFPYGDKRCAGPREFRLAEACGFKTAVTTQVRPFDGKRWFSVPRAAMREEHDADRIRAKLSGWNAFWGQDI
jgi:peptidoglycan/xylan/chitin deacetylase (PgdA/CDA1 family)